MVYNFPEIGQVEYHFWFLFFMIERIAPIIIDLTENVNIVFFPVIIVIQFSVYKTETGEMLVSSEAIVGKEDVRLPKKQLMQRWSGDKPVKQVVWEAVQELTKGDKGYIFSPKDITQIILKKYPTFNKSTVGCQIISDCVGHTSRHHYPGGENRYSWISKGQYRLYDKN